MIIEDKTVITERESELLATIVECRKQICGGELCWESDFSAEEVLDREDDGGIVSYYHCMNCGREYEISDQIKEERETTYEKYWNG